MGEKISILKNKGIIIAGVTIAVYLGMKYIVPVIIPFLFAWGIVLCINPLIKKLNSFTRINKGIIAGILLVIIGGAIGGILWLLISNMLVQVKILFENIDIYQYQFSCFIKECSTSIESMFGLKAYNIETAILENVNLFVQNMEVNLVPRIVNNSFLYLKILLKFISVFFITVIAIILLAKDYEAIKKDSSRLRGFTVLNIIGDKVLKTGLTYIKAQLIIMLLTCILATISLFLMGNPYALLLGVTIGLLDALPFIGTGAVFVPWALISVIRGDFLDGGLYIVIFIVLTLLREFLEPKLIGKKLGIYPIIIIISIYAGISIYGIAGIIFGPLSLLLIYEISKAFIEKAVDSA